MKCTLTPWHKEFLVQGDMGDLKKTYSADRISVELASFVASKKPIEELSKLIKAMYRAHAEIMKG